MGQTLQLLNNWVVCRSLHKHTLTFKMTHLFTMAQSNGFTLITLVGQYQKMIQLLYEVKHGVHV